MNGCRCEVSLGEGRERVAVNTVENALVPPFVELVEESAVGEPGRVRRRHGHRSRLVQIDRDHLVWVHQVDNTALEDPEAFSNNDEPSSVGCLQCEHNRVVELLLYEPYSDLDGTVLRDRAMGDRQFTEAAPGELWRGTKRFVALIVDADTASITHTALVHKGPQFTSTQARVSIKELKEVAQPIALADVKARIALQLRRHVDGAIAERSRLAPATLAAVLEALDQVDRAVGVELARLDRLTDQPRNTSPSAERWRLERDAIGVALSISGLPRQDLAYWNEPEQSAPFLRGVAGHAREDSLLGHDSQTFPGWFRVDIEPKHVAMVSFANPAQDRALHVMNVNRTMAETNLGVDLIYYGTNPASFTMVQYKRFVDENGTAIYRPGNDGSFEREMERMRAIDARTDVRTTAPELLGDFRLYDRACWVKICRSQPFVENADDLVAGMYLSLRYFDRLVASDEAKGRGGAVGITFERARRYLDNTTFTKLVGNGWCGSAGTSTDELSDLVEGSLNGKRSVVAAIATRPI